MNIRAVDRVVIDRSTVSIKITIYCYRVRLSFYTVPTPSQILVGTFNLVSINIRITRLYNILRFFTAVKMPDNFQMTNCDMFS